MYSAYCLKNCKLFPLLYRNVGSIVDGLVAVAVVAAAAAEVIVVAVADVLDVNVPLPFFLPVIVVY